MKKIVTLSLLLSITYNCFTQINAELRNSITPYGLYTEFLVGYEFKDVNFSAFYSLYGERGVNAKIYIWQKGDAKIFINQKIFMDSKNIFFVNMPQLGTAKIINDKFRVDLVLGPDVVRFFVIGAGICYYIK